MEKLSTNSAEDVQVTSQMLAQAMCKHATWSYIFGTDETTNLTWLFERYMALHSGHTYILRDDAGQIIATCTVRPPTLKVTTWQKIRNGLLMFPIYFGFAAYSRLEEISTFFNSDTNIPNGVYYLTSMAVREDKRGAGIGSAFLRDVLNDALPLGSKVALNTQEFRNVRFYERIGFKLVAQRKFNLNYPEISSFDTDWSMIMDV